MGFQGGEPMNQFIDSTASQQIIRSNNNNFGNPYDDKIGADMMNNYNYNQQIPQNTVSTQTDNYLKFMMFPPYGSNQPISGVNNMNN